MYPIRWFGLCVGVIMLVAAGLAGGDRSTSAPNNEKLLPGLRDKVEALPGPKSLMIDLGGEIKLEMVLIPPGSFSMGDENEKPAHQVTISKPFYIGMCEVTQEQWQAVMGNNPSCFIDPKNPVDSISWDDCQKFLSKLNSKVKGRTFRLPTEAEWEYACRAGSTTAFCFGDAESKLGDYAWYRITSDGNAPHPVGQKIPNAWGLYDVHGNVWEWCQDWYGSYTEPPQTDPNGSSSGTSRVLRGGSWSSELEWFCRSANRNWSVPGFSGLNYGVRVVAGTSE